MSTHHQQRPSLVALSTTKRVKSVKKLFKNSNSLSCEPKHEQKKSIIELEKLGLVNCGIFNTESGDAKKLESSQPSRGGKPRPPVSPVLVDCVPSAAPYMPSMYVPQPIHCRPLPAWLEADSHITYDYQTKPSTTNTKPKLAEETHTKLNCDDCDAVADEKEDIDDSDDFLLISATITTRAEMPSKTPPSIGSESMSKITLAQTAKKSEANRGGKPLEKPTTKSKSKTKSKTKKVAIQKDKVTVTKPMKPKAIATETTTKDSSPSPSAAAVAQKKSNNLETPETVPSEQSFTDITFKLCSPVFGYEDENQVKDWTTVNELVEGIETGTNGKAAIDRSHRATPSIMQLKAKNLVAERIHCVEEGDEVSTVKKTTATPMTVPKLRSTQSERVLPRKQKSKSSKVKPWNPESNSSQQSKRTPTESLVLCKSNKLVKVGLKSFGSNSNGNVSGNGGGNKKKNNSSDDVMNGIEEEEIDEIFKVEPEERQLPKWLELQLSQIDKRKNIKPSKGKKTSLELKNEKLAATEKKKKNKKEKKEKKAKRKNVEENEDILN